MAVGGLDGMLLNGDGVYWVDTQGLMSLFARTARTLINTWCAFHIKLLRTLVLCCWDCGMVGVVIIAVVALLCYDSFYTLMSDVLIIRPGYAR